MIVLLPINYDFSDSTVVLPTSSVKSLALHHCIFLTVQFYPSQPAPTLLKLIISCCCCFTISWKNIPTWSNNASHVTSNISFTLTWCIWVMFHVCSLLCSSSCSWSLPAMSMSGFTLLIFSTIVTSHWTKNRCNFNHPLRVVHENTIRLGKSGWWSTGEAILSTA